MRQLSTAFIQEKNRLEGRTAFAHLVEVVLNVNTTARFTTHPETLTFNSNIYAPVPMRISSEEQSGDGSLPKMTIDVGNPGGMAFKFAKENNLVLQNVTIRLINTSFTSSGDDARCTMQIIGCAFNDEIGTFTLGFKFNFDAEGPLRVYNRRDHPMMPSNFRNYYIL